MAFSSFQRYCLLFPFASSTTNASVVKNKDWLLIVREALTRRPKQQDFILRGCFPPAILLTITVCWIIEGGPHRFSARLSFAKSYLSSFFRQSSFEVSTKSFKVCRRVGTLTKLKMSRLDFGIFLHILYYYIRLPFLAFLIKFCPRKM